MKKIKLNKNKYALVDNEDFEYLNSVKWHVVTFYAGRTPWPQVGPKYQLMHRVLMNAKKGQIVDHINGNGLDNRKANLRIVTHAQNIMNQKRRVNNISGHRGIGWRENRQKWRVRVTIDGKEHSVGHFDRLQDAIKARNDFIDELQLIYYRRSA